ncbi:hypothetical protein [Crocosphaera sp.]|uniref:hypothetical protein n=1 Tax=Crocosphaera sp. TaxID=2729996 RepID=UPI003F27AE9C|nr:hypothetical protein [Crocosphaera sp.]
MNLREICQTIFSLIKKIIAEDQELEQSLQTSYSKVHECLNLLRNNLKEVAAIVIKYNHKRIGSFQGEYIYFDEEHGLVQSKEPLIIIGGNYPIESLAKSINEKLEATLKTIKMKQTETNQRIEQLEEFILTIKQLEQK